MPGVLTGLSPQRVLVVRLSAIGDVIHSLPVACALREAFPHCAVGWVVESRAAALLRGHPAIDELVEVPRGFLKSPGYLWQLRRRLRQWHPDVAIDVQSLSKSAVVAWLSGARWRIGFARPQGREIAPWLDRVLVQPKAVHVVEQYLELLEPLGIRRPAVRFGIPELLGEAEAAAAWIEQYGLGGGFAVLNAGSGWPSKQWPSERFAALACHLGEVWRLPSLVVWSGEGERRLAEAIVGGAGGHARLAPATSLRELAALVRRARLFVSSDTGPLHLAAALGTPCVGLYGPWPAERNGPYGPQHIAIQKIRFEGTTRQRRMAPASLMEAIDVVTVCQACDALLERDYIQAA